MLWRLISYAAIFIIDVMCGGEATTHQTKKSIVLHIAIEYV